jgi:Zn-dependent protease
MAYQPPPPPGSGGDQPPVWAPPPPPTPSGGYQQGGADIPADSPQHGNPQQRAGRNAAGVAGGAGLLGLLKYGFAAKFLLTGGTFLLSFGAYALLWGPWSAAGIVLMILIHELGHVVEIQRQGLRATAPVFIPFMGAAIFQRQHPTDALHQAEIGIAGPIAGTVGATFAFAAYGSTHFTPLLIWAWFGFFINLINLIPAGMLDGGWILAPVSKWFQVFGLALITAIYLGGLVGLLPFALSPIFIFVVILGLPATLARFRMAGSPYYTSVTPQARVALGISWLVLVVYLVIATIAAEQALSQFVR